MEYLFWHSKHNLIRFKHIFLHIKKHFTSLEHSGQLSMFSKLLPLDIQSLITRFVGTVVAKPKISQQVDFIFGYRHPNSTFFYFLQLSPVLNHHIPLKPPNALFSLWTDRQTQLLAACKESISFKQCSNSVPA